VVGRRPVAIVPPDPLAPLEVVIGGADRRLDAVDVEEPVVGIAAVLVFGEAVDRADEAAAIAGGDVGAAFQHPHHRVGFVDGDGAFEHRPRPVVAGDAEVDGADPGAGAEAAAGGRERCQEQRRRDRRAAAPGH